MCFCPFYPVLYAGLEGVLQFFGQREFGGGVNFIGSRG